MKICLTSDTHYGFSENTEGLLREMLANIQLEKPDMILHAGDWASTKHTELEKCLALFREFFPETTIVGTLGNHDFWQEDPDVMFDSVEQKLTATEALMDKYDIFAHAISAADKVNVIAFQSWYRTIYPPSKDHLYCPESHDIHIKMKNKMLESLEQTQNLIKAFPGYKHIVVSHFSPYHYRYGYTGMCGPIAMFETLIESGISYLCLGHSHEYHNEQVDECLILNAGSDYDEPKFTVFEI